LNSGTSAAMASAFDHGKVLVAPLRHTARQTRHLGKSCLAQDCAGHAGMLSLLAYDRQRFFLVLLEFRNAPLECTVRNIHGIDDMARLELLGIAYVEHDGTFVIDEIDEFLRTHAASAALRFVAYEKCEQYCEQTNEERMI